MEPINTNTEVLIEEFKAGTLELGLFAGTNDKKNIVIVKVTDNELIITTCQDNGWLRKNIYYRDGTTEEIYE